MTEDRRQRAMLEAWGTLHSIIKVTEDGFATVFFPDGTVMTGGRAVHYGDGRIEIHWPDGTTSTAHGTRKLHS